MATSIGIVGGGQLAAMLADVCRKHATSCTVLDPGEHCPAVTAGASWIEGDSWDVAALNQLASTVDVVTVEIENVCIENLRSIASSGTRVVPEVSALALLVNKLEQKLMLQAAGIPTSPFEPAPAGKPIQSTAFGLPVVWKASRGGYDGRGVQIIRQSDADFVPATDGYLEAFVETKMELAVMVAVSPDRDFATWSAVEMEFDDETNILRHLISPARVSPEISIAANKLALDAIRAIGGSGVFGVEMFLTTDGELLVNEIAPRTHNSGHVTMDISITSQFEQQYRILTDQALAPTDETSPAVMSNILGAPGYRGDTVVENLLEVEAMPNTHVHLYGKKQCFSQRKMGHVTLTGADIDQAIERMNQVQSQLIVRGEHRDA